VLTVMYLRISIFNTCAVLVQEMQANAGAGMHDTLNAQTQPFSIPPLPTPLPSDPLPLLCCLLCSTKRNNMGAAKRRLQHAYATCDPADRALALCKTAGNSTQPKLRTAKHACMSALYCIVEEQRRQLAASACNFQQRHNTRRRTAQSIDTACSAVRMLIHC
jgi:hypothetical protein